MPTEGSRDLSIYLIDDHALLRAGLRMVLEAGIAGARVREFSSLTEFNPPHAPLVPLVPLAPHANLASAGQQSTESPDLVLLDLELPGLNGLEGLTVLKAKWPATPLVMLSSHTEPEMKRTALARGAAAYISKAESSAHIIATIMAVLRGESAALITQRLVGAPTNNASGAHLTARQCEVLDLLCQGLPNKLIGRRLTLSENTVRGHVQAVLGFLQVSSRAEAAFAARQRGLVR